MYLSLACDRRSTDADGELFLLFIVVRGGAAHCWAVLLSSCARLPPRGNDADSRPAVSRRAHIIVMLFAVLFCVYGRGRGLVETQWDALEKVLIPPLKQIGTPHDGSRINYLPIPPQSTLPLIQPLLTTMIWPILMNQSLHICKG